MKLNFPTLRIAAALGLAAGMMIGCQDLMNPGKTTSDPGATSVDQIGSLSLSIRNDSACMGEWHAILDARSAGHPDSASEAAFLASCVTEVKPEKDKPVPVVPPPLRPDSGTRCKWIVAQIEGGRDSLTVSYRKYCPEDCRTLEVMDSTSHEKLCRDPKPHDSLPVPPPPPVNCDSLRKKLSTLDSGSADYVALAAALKGHCPEKPPLPDSTKIPPKPPMPDSVCMALKLQLADTLLDSAQRASLEAAFKAKCKEPFPLPPPPPPVNCDSLRKQLAALDSGSADYAKLAITLKEHCPEKPPLPDTAKLPPKPPAPDSVCMNLKMLLSTTPPGTAGRSDLEAAFKAKCVEPLPVPPPADCDSLRMKLAAMDTASVDYAQLTAIMKGVCPAPVK